MCILCGRLGFGTAGADDIDPFDFSQNIDENIGTPDFVKYHEKQLQACGVLMGRKGYEIYILHSELLYRV